MSQEINPDPISADLAKRLAEAADGLQDGKYYYFLSKRTYPHELESVAGETEQEANDAAETLLAQLNLNKEDNLFYKFGPYRSEIDLAISMIYDSIEIRFLNSGSLVHTKILEGDTDGIILSLSAYRKFFHNYFVRLYGDVIAGTMEAQARIDLAANPMRVVYHRNRTLSSVG